MATKYTEEEVNYMKSMALKHFDLIMDILRDMPRSLLLVVRNLNTVRSIARDHGDVVDRPKVMARYAITCLLKSSDNFFQGLRRKVFFEYRLW